MGRQNDPGFTDFLKDIGEAIDNALGFVIDRLGHKMTYSEYLDITGEYIDEKIVKECREKKLYCYGGKAKIGSFSTYDNGKEKSFVSIAVELYYKNQMGQWVKTAFRGKTPIQKFDLKDSNTLEQINNFKNCIIDEIDIVPPKSEA